MRLTEHAKPMRGYPYYIHNDAVYLVAKKNVDGMTCEEIHEVAAPVYVAYSWQLDVLLRHRGALILSLSSFRDETLFGGAFSTARDFMHRAIDRYRIDKNSTLSVHMEGYINSTVYRDIHDEEDNRHYLREVAGAYDPAKGVYLHKEEVETYFSLPSNQRVGLPSPKRLNPQHGPFELTCARSPGDLPESEVLLEAGLTLLNTNIPHSVSFSPPFNLPAAGKDNTVVPFRRSGNVVSPRHFV